MRQAKGLGLTDVAQRAVVDAALDPKPVSGLTHNHYKYPARFSPGFAAAVIQAFTEPGDLVFDPFMGGGTTIVEALANGRNAVGVDISSLAAFVSETKTLNIADAELKAVRRWARRLFSLIDMHQPPKDFPEWEEAGYYRNLRLRTNWRLTKAIEQALGSTERLLYANSQQLARCVVLRTAQWALDGRKVLPTVEQFRNKLAVNALQMIEGVLAFRQRRSQHPVIAPRYLNRSVVGIARRDVWADAGSPRLILTSPPYPGVHVLYHRWQVDGRKETPAPFWIANKLDGAGLSFYAMGDRKSPGLRTYFENMQLAFDSIADCATSRTTLVQMLAFSAPDWQLPRYLQMMDNAGFAELLMSDMDSPDGRLWRDVPSRKWHANQRGKTPGSQEVVLFHRKKAANRERFAMQPSRAFAASEASAAESGTGER